MLGMLKLSLTVIFEDKYYPEGLYSAVIAECIIPLISWLLTKQMNAWNINLCKTTAMLKPVAWGNPPLY